MSSAHGASLALELTRVIDVPVEIRAVRDAFVVVPVNRAHLRSPTWAALRDGPRGGVGRSPEEAALLLACAAGVVAGGARRPAAPRMADAWLRGALEASGGTETAAEVTQAARAAGIAPETLRRAAARIGVVRRKLGLRVGWTWTLPVDARPAGGNATAGIEDGMTGIEGGMNTFEIEAGTAGEEQTP